MSTVLLIRHGESESNIGLPSLNPRFVPLTRKGWLQAKEIAQYLKAQPPDLIVISPYRRSKETAKPTMKALSAPVVEDWPVHEFTYLASWRDEYTTVEERKPVVDLYWELAEPDLVDGPGAESFQQFIWRVWDVKERLEKPQYKGTTVGIFTHEQFISAFRWLLELERDSPDVDEADMREFRRYLLENPVANGKIVPIRLGAKISSSTGPMPTPV